MKSNILLFSFLGILLFSCSKKEVAVDENAARNAEMQKQNAEEQAPLSPLEEGKAMIEGADCLSCHKIDEKMIGPSYLDVAGKYENTPENIELLAGKIVEGGSGVWGTVPMAAHPGMSKENAKKMVEYILSLKK